MMNIRRCGKSPSPLCSTSNSLLSAPHILNPGPLSGNLIRSLQNNFRVSPFVKWMKSLKSIKKYTVEPTRRTPRVILEPGRFFIVGRSIPENPGEFYRPVFDWISNYVHARGQRTCIELGFEYINTSSTKWIYNIIKEISSMKDIIENVSICWYYDAGDEDMCELGFIMKSLVDCPFLVIESEVMERTPDDQFAFNAM